MAFITAIDGRRADAALLQRFRQAQNTRERTAVFADVVRQHGDAVLYSCAERLWTDADAAVAAAGEALIAARLVMADSTKLPRPDLLRGWLLGIAAQACRIPGLPARIDEINWEAVGAAAVPGMQGSPTRPASLRQWLERIVATLPEPRQRMYHLFVTRGLDSRNAALELGTTAAEVRRLRRENRQAILRAFEVTALADTDMALDLLGSGAPGCGELRQILADAHRDSDPPQDGRPHTVVLPTAARLTLSLHLGQCHICQDRRDDCLARWVPELLPLLADAELYEQVMADLQSMPELSPPVAAPGARRRVSPVGTAAAGAGLLVALLLLAFVWPGFLHGTGGSVAPASQALNGGGATAGLAAPAVSSTSGEVSGTNERTVRPGATGNSSSRPPVANASLAAPSYPSVPPSAYYTVPPSTSPTSSAGEPTSGPPPTVAPAEPSPSPSSQQSQSTSPTPTPATSTTPASTPSPSPSASTTSPAPSPSASTTTPTPTPSPATTTPTPDPSPSTPASATSAPAASPSSTAASPTASPSTVASSTATPAASASS